MRTRRRAAESSSSAAVQAVLTQSAVDLGTPGFDTVSGFGRMDGLAAAELIDVSYTELDPVVDPAAASGSASLVHDGIERNTVFEWSLGNKDATDAEFAKAVPATVTRRAAEAVGDFAWIATEGRTVGSYKDRAVDRITSETMVLKREGGTWKIAHIHWSSAASGQ